MNRVERTIRLFAGFMVTVSIALGYFVSPYWFLLTLFVGVNMMQSAFTRWCLAETIIKKYNLGFKRS
ncbi:MAG: DUF2892 domain-containing protein [Balneolaceae bacterium]|nr:DUF2892 domain-containing protein [Balneolaceae bacterium]